MSKKTIFIILGIIAVFATLVGVSIWQKDSQNSQDSTSTDYSDYKLSTIKDLSAKIDYDSLDLHSIISASAATGNFEENIIGDKNAPIIIYEYADYPCSFCAMMNPLLNKIVEDYKGKVAIVFRSYILSYHEQNGIPAASAANAAALQGYWKEYKNLLFSKQDDWFYSTGDKLQKQLENYFEQASNGKGDLAKFRQDMQSEAVAKKIAFDRGIGDQIKIGGTPWLYMDGEWISNKKSDDDTTGLSPLDYSNRIRNLIDQKLQ